MLKRIGFYVDKGCAYAVESISELVEPKQYDFFTWCGDGTQR